MFKNCIDPIHVLSCCMLWNNINYGVAYQNICPKVYELLIAVMYVCRRLFKRNTVVEMIWKVGCFKTTKMKKCKLD